jgi:Short C-terminal domain
MSAADEDLTKLTRLKEQGILSKAEFNQMKEDILRKL